MKNTIYSAILLLSAVLPAAAAETAVNLDFDGAFSEQPSAGPSTALSVLNSAAPAKLRPAALPGIAGDRGGIPDVPPPTCVDGCGGDDGGDDQPYYPPPPPYQPPAPNPAPQPVPQPVPQPQPQPQPQPWTPPYVPPTPPSVDFQHKPFVASVCLAMADGSSDCRKGSGQEAINKLEASIRQDIIEELVKNGIVMVFPVATNPAELYGALKTALQHGIDQLAISMQEDMDQLMQDMGQPGWGTQVDKARMARIIANNERMLKLWKAAALLEAENGGNWAKTGPASYKFVGGPAYEKLKEGLQAKEIFTGNSRRRAKKAR